MTATCVRRPTRPRATLILAAGLAAAATAGDEPPTRAQTLGEDLSGPRLNVMGTESRFALMKEYQVDPASGELLPTDFFEVSLTDELRVTVTVTTKGEPIGVKRDGGILQHGIREIEIQCLPDKIPGHVEVDVSSLETGKSIHVSDLNLGEGIKILTDLDELIATVTSPVAEEAAAAPAAGEIAEPEVIKKGKKEEEAEG